MRKITKIENTALQPVKRKRVAAYARVSSGKDAMLHSISAQISYYNNYIGSRGDWELVGIYADTAMTGTKDNRPEFRRLLTDCRAGKIDMVITKSITRMARNTVTLLTTARELKDLEIDIYFEKENIHTMSTDGELMLTLLASFAQEESRSVSENLKWRIRKKFEKGLATNGEVLGYRFKDGTFHVVQEEAQIVRRIFDSYLSGMGITAIMKQLDREGIPAKHGGRWSKSSIGHILRNEKYTGDLLLQKYYHLDPISKKLMENHGELPQYFVENNHEPIVSKEMFERTQQELKRRAKRFNAGKTPYDTYLLTGIIHCSLCGKHFRRKIANSTCKCKKIVWCCCTFNIYGKDACPAQQIPEDILIAKTSEVLGITDWNREDLLERVAEIQVPEHNTLIYVFKDGHSQKVHWQHRSRKYSWTPEMKQRASEREKERARKRKIKEAQKGEEPND